MMRFCLLWVLLLTSNLGVMSQTLRKYLISGVVLDSVSNPVDYSTVILSTPDGRSVNYAVTDTSGCFRLENTVPGKYQLTISNIAYKTRNIPLEIIDRDWFAKIVLEKGTLITEDVVITASRIKRKSDGYVVSFQNNPLTSGKNAAEAIGYLPSVKAIGGSFMIQGQPVSRIRINGMTISDPKELEALQAENIDHVEVVLTGKMDEFDAGPGGEINITLKKSPVGGFIGSVTGVYSAYFKHGYANSGVNSSFFYNKNKVGIYNYLDFSDNQTYSDNEDRYFYKDEEQTRNTISKVNTHSLSVTDRLSVNYDPSDKHKLGIAFRYSRNNSDPFSNVYTTVNDEGLSPTASRFIDDGHSSRNQYQATLNYRWFVGGNGAYLNVRGDYLHHMTDSRNDYETRYDLSGSGSNALSDFSRNSSDRKVNQYYASATYNFVPFKESKMSVGFNYKGHTTHFTQDYLDMKQGMWERNDILSDHYQLAGNYYAGLATLSGKITPRLDYRATVRYESLAMRYNSLYMGLENRKTYNNFSIVAGLRYCISEEKHDYFNFSYLRWYEPVPYNVLSPVVTYVNDYFYTKGNVNLRPLTADNLLFTFSLRDKTEIGLRLQRTNNLLVWRSFNDPDDPLVIYTMPVNERPSYNVQFSVDRSFRIMDQWSIYAYGLLEWRNFYNPLYDAMKGSFITLWILENRVDFKKGFGGSTYFYVASGSKLDERSYGPKLDFSLSLYKYLLNRRMQISAGFSVHNTGRWTTIETPELIQKRNANANLAQFTFKVIYNFRGGKKVKERKIENLQTYDETHDELVR